MEWTNRVAIVTGASSGIGRAVACDFARREVKVALVARSVDKLDSLAGEIGRSNVLGFEVRPAGRSSWR